MLNDPEAAVIEEGMLAKSMKWMIPAEYYDLRCHRAIVAHDRTRREHPRLEDRPVGIGADCDIMIPTKYRPQRPGEERATFQSSAEVKTNPAKCTKSIRSEKKGREAAS
jgi:hypothetical protein